MRMPTLDFIEQYVAQTYKEWSHNGIVDDVFIHEQEYQKWCHGLEEGVSPPPSWSFFWNRIRMEKIRPPSPEALQWVLEPKRHAWAIPLLDSYTKNSIYRNEILFYISNMDIPTLFSANVIFDALGKSHFLPAMRLLKKNANLNDIVDHVSETAPCWAYEPILLAFYEELLDSDVDSEVRRYFNKVFDATQPALQMLIQEKIIALDAKDFYKRSKNFPIATLVAFYRHRWAELCHHDGDIEEEMIGSNEHLRLALLKAFIEQHHESQDMPSPNDIRYVLTCMGFLLSSYEKQAEHQALLEKVNACLDAYGINGHALLAQLTHLMDTVDLDVFVNTGLNTFLQYLEPMHEIPLLD